MGGGSPSMYSHQEGRKACAGLAYLWGSPWPSHLLGLYDVSQVSIREDPTVERGKVLLHPGPGRALPHPAARRLPCHTHCSPWQVERAAKELGLPLSFPW